MLLPFIAAVVLLPVDSKADEVEFELREKIVYSKVRERELLLDAFLPTGKELRPAILVVHGGAWRSGNRGQLRGYATTLTKMGFACFAIDYRLAGCPGSGLLAWPLELENTKFSNARHIDHLCE